MERLNKLLKNLQAFDHNKVIIETLRSDKKPLLDKNREQLERGVKTDDSAIVPGYSSRYKRARQRKGLQTSKVDLKVSGDLYKGLDYYTTNKETIFFTRVEYGQYLANRYAMKPSHIYGVTDENLKKAFDEVYKKIMMQIVKREVFRDL